MFYFAYGSNMNHRQMLDVRCPGARFIGRAILDRQCLVYDGFSPGWGGAVVNIDSSRQDEVHGGLFEITPQHLSILDGYEGYPAHCQRRQETVLSGSDHTKVPAWIYYRPPQAPGMPSRIYLETLLRGARDCGLPEDYIQSSLDIFPHKASEHIGG